MNVTGIEHSHLVDFVNGCRPRQRLSYAVHDTAILTLSSLLHYQRNMRSRSSIFLEDISHGGLTIAALGIVGHSNEENAFTTDTFLALTSPGDLLIDRLGVDQQLSQH
jgi:hypothetical protein